MEQKIKSETEANMECFIYLMIGEVVCHENEVDRQLEQGKSFAEHNKVVYDVALEVAKSYDEQLQLRMDAYARERKALAEIEKLRKENAELKITVKGYIANLNKTAEAASYFRDRYKAVEQEVIDKAETWLRENATDYLDKIEDCYGGNEGEPQTWSFPEEFFTRFRNELKNGDKE